MLPSKYVFLLKYVFGQNSLAWHRWPCLPPIPIPYHNPDSLAHSQTTMSFESMFSHLLNFHLLFPCGHPYSHTNSKFKCHSYTPTKPKFKCCKALPNFSGILGPLALLQLPIHTLMIRTHTFVLGMSARRRH